MTSETASIRVMVATVAVSLMSLTTTLNTSAMMDTPPTVIMGNISENDMGTSTLFPKSFETKNELNYNQAKNLFIGDMRDFTKQEAEQYQQSLNKIYKSIGVNIFDLC